METFSAGPPSENDSAPNPYLAAQRAPTPTASAQGVEELSLAQCWDHLAHGTVGRLALDSVDGRPDVFPVNYVVRETKVYFRSAPGSKLHSIALHPEVAFEVDGHDFGHFWSVVVRGMATRMDTDAEIEASGVLRLESASPTSKFDFIRLAPQSVTGRRFRKRPSTAAPEKPMPIPHFSPRPHKG